MHFSPEEKNNEMYSVVFMRFRYAYTCTKIGKLVKDYAPGGVNLGQTIDVKNTKYWSMYLEYDFVPCIEQKVCGQVHRRIN